jgi:rfaE bifunctional protein kinase chain/domain
MEKLDSMKEQSLKEILLNLKNITIAVIGDFFLDKYLQIDRSRKELSLETGLEAYQIANKRTVPGAAGTVAKDLKVLGVGLVTALGFIGDDGEGYELNRGLENLKIETEFLIKTKERFTPTYIKPIFNENSIIKETNRLDIKNFSTTPKFLEDKIIERLKLLAKKADGIVVLDQVPEDNCGVITEMIRETLSQLMNVNKNLIIVTDSRNHVGLFNNVIIKCNNFEAAKVIDPDIKDQPGEEIVKKAGLFLNNKTGKPVFVTCGENGQLVFDDNKIKRIPAIPVEGPLDKVGAGDATTTGIISALCCNSSLYDAALLGNIVSSIAIQQLGTTGAATPEQVLERFKAALNA